LAVSRDAARRAGLSTTAELLVMFIARILVCICRPKDGIALGLFGIEMTMAERQFYELD